ncbi:hypothetical protein [Lusitaniella coriacea]|uniref:hypothetical protein n=1 Tax=Lusitaniella coriacea TaxID=1983105 RepID=UPI003CEA5E53
MVFFRLNPLLPVAILLSIPLGSLTARSQPYEGCYFIDAANRIVNLNELCRNSPPGDLAPPPAQDTSSNEPQAENSLALECNQIVSIANEAADNTKNLTNDGDIDDVEAMLNAAEALDGAAEQMESVSLNDVTLEGYRTRFIQMYQQTSQAARKFVVAYREENTSSAEVALANLQAATAPEAQLIESINQYCS